MNASVVIGSVLLDKYRVERILGQGGMGYVIAVRHIDLGQLHAMKFLLPDALGHPEAVERFLREAQAAAVLRSHHVVRVHDVGRMPGGGPYMVMEYLEGCDLKKYLELHGPLPIDEVVRFVLHACDAIAEAHRRGIIHRDLKPANLFLTQQRDGDPIVKVVDFGISKHTDSDKPELTDTNATLGSPLYMSPEQIAKSKTVDTGTDIWALGLIAYELLTGISPFRASSVLEVAAKVLQDEPRPLREVRPDVPLGLAATITRCLRKKREERWASVEAFADALREFVAAAPQPRPPQPSATSEVPAEPKVVARAPFVAPVLTPVPSQTAAVSSVGEPTGITFGATGKSNLMRRVRTTQWTLVAVLVATGLGFVALIAIYFRLVTNVTTTMDSTPIAVLAEAPPISQPETIQKDEPVKPMESAVPKMAPVPAPIVKTTATAKAVKAPIKQEKPAEPTPSIQPIKRRNPVAL